MTKVDLITGFLGAGKTTFIHRYLRHLHDQKILIIENEFGSIGVDAQFLRDEGCPVEDLSGVCMCCKGRDRFIAMLINAGAHGYDRVLVEPSGIYDVDEFFSVMDVPAVAACCEIGSVLAIVDAHAPENLSMETGYLMVTQLLAAGAVVLSKTQNLPAPGNAADTVSWLNDLIRSYGGARALDADVCTKDWEDLTEEDFESLMTCGYRHDSHRHVALNHGEIYDSFITAGYCRDEEDLKQKIAALLRDEHYDRYGCIFRVKGFLRDGDKNWYKVNCTRSDLSIEPAPNVRRGVLVIIGRDMNEAALGKMFPRKRRD